MQEIKEILRELYKQSCNLTPKQYEQFRAKSEKNARLLLKDDPVAMKMHAKILDGMKACINRTGGGFIKWMIWKGA